MIPCVQSYKLLCKLRGEAFADSTVGKGYFTTIELKANEDLPHNKIYKTFKVYERYCDNTALHILGYTDIDGEGVCGIEKFYNNELKKYGGELSIAYNADATERMITDITTEVRNNNYFEKTGIVLTLDKDIQIIAENALKNGNITKGAAIVLEAESCAILACASTPVYDRNNISEYLSSPDSPFINRALTAFPVGSVFKCVTSAAAIENNIPLIDYTCTGSIEKSGNIFNCNKNDGHGRLNFYNALAHSCNPYFIELSTKTGGERLLKTAKALGFGKSVDLGNGFMSDEGNLPDIKELNSDAALGNFGFGQGSLTATPLQIAACFAVFANGGIYNTPYLYKGVTDKSGAFTPEIKINSRKALKDTTCKVISDALYKVTESGTGKAAKSIFFDACTKTATAQSGQYDENGNEIKYCWFAGYFPYDNPRYVICILKENGSSGGTDGAPVFKEISENIYFYEKYGNQ